MLDEISDTLNMLGSTTGAASWIRERRKEKEFEIDPLKTIIISLNDDKSLNYPMHPEARSESEFHVSIAIEHAWIFMNIVKGLMQIDPGILKACSKRLQIAAKMREFNQKNNTQQEKKFYNNEQSKGVIREILSKIKINNRGELPAILETYSKSYCCSNGQ
jgi:hypothetical protein